MSKTNRMPSSQSCASEQCQLKISGSSYLPFPMPRWRQSFFAHFEILSIPQWEPW